MSQLKSKSAKLISDFFMLPVEEQTLVFNVLSKQYQTQQPVFPPFPLFQPQPHSPPVWEHHLQQQQQLLINSQEKIEAQQEEEGEEGEEQREEEQVQKKSQRREEYQAEPLEKYCIQVCDADECICRYKPCEREKKEDYVPDLNLNGVYVFNLSRTQGYLYIIERAGLTRRHKDERIRVFANKGCAYVTLDNHEQAVQVYKNLRMNGVSVNWQKERE